jgi:hypothetical protein
VDQLRPATFDAEVTPAGRPAAFAVEGSPFARLELEQAAAAAARLQPHTQPLAPPTGGPGSTAAIPGLEPLAAPPLTEPLEPRSEPPLDPPEVPQPADAESSAAFRREPQRLVTSEEAPDEAEAASDEPGEVDRVMLAKEFSGLLQLNEDGDEDNS